MRQNQFSSRSSGQALVLALGVFVIACVSFFMMFNSGRAVNEKINLVNAADAAAYSGAQVAARHLNFMAYTNRAMIANEVMIAHTFSFNSEVKLIGDIFANGLTGGGLLGNLVNAMINLFFPGFTSAAAQFLQPIVDTSKVVTSVMMLMMDANNASFSNFQQQAFLDLVSVNPNTGAGLIDESMATIAASYIIRSGAPISVNDPLTLYQFQSSADANVQSAMQNIGNFRSDLCEMILFARPGPSTGGQPNGNGIGAYCNSLQAGGFVNNAAGNPNNPVRDGGQLISAINETVQNMENATWIRDRNVSNYQVNMFGAATGLRADRVGSTEIQYNASRDQLNWVAANDSLRIKVLGIPLMTANESKDAAVQVEEAGALFDMASLRMLQSIGLCSQNGTVNCASLTNAKYDGINRYATLNPNNSTSTITAFLHQNNCSDNIGVDDQTGAAIPGWNNQMASVDRAESFCNKNVYAIANAEVFYQRPDCYQQGRQGGTCSSTDIGFSSPSSTGQRENPNLFNPFWHARLVQ